MFFSCPIVMPYVAQKIKFYVKDFSSKWEEIYSFLRISSYSLIKKSLTRNFILCLMPKMLYTPKKGFHIFFKA